MVLSLLLLGFALPALGGVIVERAPTVTSQFLGKIMVAFRCKTTQR
jgi:hypothetical protein